MHLNLYAHFNETGIGRHAENFHRHLLPLAVGRFSVSQTIPGNKEGIIKLLTGLADGDTTIFFVMQNSQFLNLFKGRKILWQAFETDRIPSKWRDHLTHYDAIWVPTQWGFDVLTSCGVPADRIRIVPEGVDTKAYTPNPLAHEGFVFLCVGKYEKRKGINELIMAFVQEFPREKYPEVILRLKADFPMFPELLQKLKENVAFDDRIQVLAGDLTDAEIIALYNGADAFVFPSRAEGFGLPCIEAIACGLPLIATNYSGQTEFLREIEGLFLPIAHDMEPIEDFLFDFFFKEIYAGEPYGQWAKPDVASIRRGMREIYENRDAWREKAARASAVIREKFDWSRAAEQAAGELGKS